MTATHEHPENNPVPILCGMFWHKPAISRVFLQEVAGALH